MTTSCGQLGILTHLTTQPWRRAAAAVQVSWKLSRPTAERGRSGRSRPALPTYKHTAWLPACSAAVGIADGARLSITARRNRGGSDCRPLRRRRHAEPADLREAGLRFTTSGRGYLLRPTCKRSADLRTPRRVRARASPARSG